MQNEDYYEIQRVLKHLDDRRADGADVALVAADAGLSVDELEQLCDRWCEVEAEYFIECALALDSRLVAQVQRAEQLDTDYSMPGERRKMKRNRPNRFQIAEPSDAERLGIIYGFIPSPYGQCLLGLIEERVCHLAYTLEDETAAVTLLKEAWKGFKIDHDQEAIDRFSEKNFAEFDATHLDICLPPAAKNFQIGVSNLIQDIPSGSVCSYGELASRLGSPKGARAVGSAAAKNTIAELIPCHRIVGSSGSTGGYRWGADRKRAILLREHILLNHHW
ncbi:MAG: methylated-DNA--[protein]-cysteine S-methyltransferase [Gammaproteobacteria bacterium]